MPSNNQPVSNNKPKSKPPSSQQEIDLPTLAQKIYTLLKRDLKIEQERLGKRNG